MLLFIHAVFVFESKSRHFTRGGAKQWKISVRQLWLLRQTCQILKMTLPQKNGYRIKTPSSKLMILVSFCWEKNYMYALMHTTFSFCPLFSWNYWSYRCCILSGPPCIVWIISFCCGLDELVLTSASISLCYFSFA